MACSSLLLLNYFCYEVLQKSGKGGGGNLILAYLMASNFNGIHKRRIMVRFRMV